MNYLSLVLMGFRHLKDNIITNQINSGVMETNEEIISRLKFIGYIQKDEKIDSQHVLRQPNTWTTTLYRTILSPDNRNKSLNFLREVINRSFEILQSHIDKERTNDASSVIIDLQNSKNGLTNLKRTYLEDTKFCCDIDVLIQKIDSKLTEINNVEEEKSC